MVPSCKYALLLVLGAVANHGVLGYETQNCWSQTCLDCPATKEYTPGEQVQCSLNQVVNVDWLNQQRPSFIPPVNLNNLVDFACIKMVAANDRESYRDTTDVIRGCVIAQSAQAICDGLVGTELARNKRGATCSFCTGDYCNGSGALASSLLVLFISLLISKIISN